MHDVTPSVHPPCSTFWRAVSRNNFARSRGVFHGLLHKNSSSSRAQPHDPILREVEGCKGQPVSSAFCLLLSVFCFLSSAFCLPSSFSELKRLVRHPVLEVHFCNSFRHSIWNDTFWELERCHQNRLLGGIQIAFKDHESL